MAHYSELGVVEAIDGHDFRRVLTVVVVGNEHEGQSTDPYQQEILGLAWLAGFGPTAGKLFRKTSYNGSFRHSYGSKGQLWCEGLDGFTITKPFPSWTFNTETLNWDAPTPMPDDGHIYEWDEMLQIWMQMD